MWLQKSKSNCILSVLLKGSWGVELNALVCLNAYCPPNNTGSVTSFWEELEEVIHYCESQYPNAATILCGDFNSRVGSGISRKIFDHNEVFLSDHSSLDKVANTQGRRLFELMSSFQLTCPHGSFFG